MTPVMTPASARGSACIPMILACVVALACLRPAAAHTPMTASEASALSALPIAVSVAAPASVLVGGGTLVVIAVSRVAEGTLCVLERVSDGTRASVVLAGDAALGASGAAGTVLAVSAVGAGWVLSAAGAAIAFVPNEIGRALLYTEQVTR
jgi:hypothetical protein